MTTPETPTKRRGRLVSRGDDDRLEIVRTGNRKMRLGDCTCGCWQSWKQLLDLIVAIYVSINLLFALAYLAFDGIENARPGSFSNAFFLQRANAFSTIGYGRMVPVGLAANLLVMLEALTGFAVPCAGHRPGTFPNSRARRRGYAVFQRRRHLPV